MTFYLQNFNVEIQEESDFSTQFIYNDPSTSLPMNLTGYRAEIQVRNMYAGVNDPGTKLTYTSGPDGGLVLGAAQGTIDWYVAYSDTQNTNWHQGIYNLVLIAPNSARIMLAKGFFTIIRSSTRLANTELPDIYNSTTNPGYPNNLGAGGLSTSD